MKKLTYFAFLAVATLSLNAMATKLTVNTMRTVYCENFSLGQKLIKARIARERAVTELGPKAETELSAACYAKGGSLEISRKAKVSCEEENIFTYKVCVSCSVTLTGNCNH